MAESQGGIPSRDSIERQLLAIRFLPPVEAPSTRKGDVTTVGFTRDKRSWLGPEGYSVRLTTRYLYLGSEAAHVGSVLRFRRDEDSSLYKGGKEQSYTIIGVRLGETSMHAVGLRRSMHVPPRPQNATTDDLAAESMAIEASASLKLLRRGPALQIFSAELAEGIHQLAPPPLEG